MPLRDQACPKRIMLARTLDMLRPVLQVSPPYIWRLTQSMSTILNICIRIWKHTRTQDTTDVMYAGVTYTHPRYHRYHSQYGASLSGSILMKSATPESPIVTRCGV